MYSQRQIFVIDEIGSSWLRQLRKKNGLKKNSITQIRKH